MAACRLFVLIFLLTLSDAVCTAAGMRLGVIAEANPLLRGLMTAHPELTSAGVCVFVGAILCIMYPVREQVRWLGSALSAVAVIKLAVLGMHLGWILQIV